MLDNGTLLAAIGLSNFVLALVLLVYSKPRDVALPARLWIIGSLLLAAACSVFPFRLPSLFWGLHVPNAVAIAGSCLQWGGVSCLLHVASWRKLTSIATIGLTSYQLGLYFVDVPLHLRIVCLSAGLSASFVLFTIVYGGRWRTGSLLLRMMTVANAVVAIGFGGRMIDAIRHGPGYSVVTVALFQHMTYLLVFAGLQVNGFGFVIALKEHADHELVRLATLDPLTEVLNRRGLLEASRKQLADARRSVYPISVLVCDIDHFKQINDSHGHTVGDEVLKVLVESIRATMRLSDLAARWGGEEFVLLLPHTELAGAEQLALRLNASFARQSVVGNGQRRVSATISVGVVQLQPREDILSAIGRADKAMYRAKESGRNRVVSEV